MISVVTPAYNEARNLPVMYERLRAVLDSTGVDWEWIIIDDSSSDDTFAAGEAITAMDRRVRVFRFSRNFGSHAATICGLDHARGDCAVVMASDLQDPPEVIMALLAGWREGVHIVWAVRSQREGESRSTLALSRLYYWIMRKVAGLKDVPATGSDFVLLDRRVIDAVCRFPEQNASLFALVTWMGFRQTSVAYEKQARLHGRSGWTLSKKIKLVVELADVVHLSAGPMDVAHWPHRFDSRRNLCNSGGVERASWLTPGRLDLADGRRALPRGWTDVHARGAR